MDNSYCEEVDVTSWSDVLDKHSELRAEKGSVWIFRGEESLCHDLSTSLERAASDNNNNIPKNIKQLEDAIIREFKRRLHQYRTDIPRDDDILEWLALMRHYGAPTRLLDWSYSFFVALYFAIQKAKESKDSKECQTCCRVWALDMKPLRIVGNENENQDEIDITFGKERWELQNQRVKEIFAKSEDCIYAVNPFRLNERLAIQQGLFLMPGNVSTPFRQNLNASPKVSLKQFKIPVEIRREFLRQLHYINISSASLFPGLSGFAESLATRLAFPDLLSLGYEFAELPEE